MPDVTPIVEQALLSTKLTLPHQPPMLIARDALFARLDQGITAKLTLLSAPAGFGKTTLAASWSAARGAVGWLSLDSGDNDPVRFWRYIIAACWQFGENIGNSALALLQSSEALPFQSPQVPYEAILTALLNDLAQLATPSMLILDDYHVVTSDQIHRTLDFLLDHLPATTHLMILTRSDPPLALTRLRAHGVLLELHATDLRFSCDETQAFAERAIPYPLESEAIAQLHQRTEGWMAGLNLLALALQGRADAQEREHFLTTFNGSHRHILDYLIGDVFDAQSEAIQAFLLQTSGLPRLNASLCNAVTERNDSDLILHEMEHANLFLEPLDSSGEWYRYHTLFAEALQHEARRRLGEPTLHVCASRASAWFEAHGLIAEAVEVAQAVQDYPRVVALLNSLIGPQHAVPPHLYFSLGKWLGALPTSVLYCEASLCFVYAMFLTFSDYHSRASAPELEAALQMAERGFQTEGSTSSLGELYAFRSLLCMWREDISAAAAFAHQALQWLSDDYTMWLSMSLGAVSWERLQAGKLDESKQLLLKSIILSERAQNNHGTRPLNLALADIYFKQGELRQSDAICRQVLPEAERDLADKAKALEFLGQLAYEWNDLDDAERNAQEALTLIRQTGDKFIETRIVLLLVRICHACRQPAQAQRMLHTLIAEMQPYIPPLLYQQLLACQARFSLEAGDIFAAQRWWLTARNKEGLGIAQQEQEDLIAARLLIVHGKADEALDLLKKWQASAHEGGRTRSGLEIRMLMVKAYVADNQLTVAQHVLQEVLALTHSEGYQRLFLDEGELIGTLLQNLLPDLRDPTIITYVQRLLRIFSLEKGTTSVLDGAIIDPLSPQEERVLRLFAAGHSREEIASELVVSVNTVKTHLQRVYRKLNVTSRQQARQMAHDLYLL